MEFTRDIARTILDGFDRHYRLFREISAGAKHRFESADWSGVREASRARIGFYDQRVRETVALLHTRFPEARRVDRLWSQIKHAYIGLLYDHQQPECAETFYNSVACRVLDRAYYRNEFIFWRPAVSTEHISSVEPTYRGYSAGTRGLQRSLEEMIRDFGLTRPWQDLSRDLDWVTREIEAHLTGSPAARPDFQLQVLSSLFFRNQAAYVIGRAIHDYEEHPFAIPIRQSAKGELYLDAILFRPDDIGRLFSLGRAYFMADMEVPSAYVAFLRSLVPTKPAAELYTALGLQKQGKTLFYRDLHDHLLHSTDAFTIAPGTRGMVMFVFTLPSFPYVFKVIRDWFDPPKETTVRDVKEKYLHVKLHDRVGRMTDAFEYSDVAFPLQRFEPEVVQELLQRCKNSVLIAGDPFILKHLYIERRLMPLDLLLKGAGDEQLRHTIHDYGRALDELAGANLFPGDLLLKNFGLTRWGRVVLYDFDEICPLTDLTFRRMPEPRDEIEEYSAEPFFDVGPRDVFPEQFPSVLFRAGRERQLFLELHGRLADPDYWKQKQDQIHAGVQEPLFPYPDERRFALKYGRGQNG